MMENFLETCTGGKNGGEGRGKYLLISLHYLWLYCKLLQQMGCMSRMLDGLSKQVDVEAEC